MDETTARTKAEGQAQPGQQSPLDEAVEALGKARAALRAKHTGCFSEPKQTCDAAHRLDAALGEAERIARLAQKRQLVGLGDVPDSGRETAAVEPTPDVPQPTAGACGGGDVGIWAGMLSDALGNVQADLRDVRRDCFRDGEGEGQSCSSILALDQSLREARPVATGLAHGRPVLASGCPLAVDRDDPARSGGDAPA